MVVIAPVLAWMHHVIPPAIASIARTVGSIISHEPLTLIELVNEMRIESQASAASDSKSTSGKMDAIDGADANKTVDEMVHEIVQGLVQQVCDKQCAQQVTA